MTTDEFRRDDTLFSKDADRSRFGGWFEFRAVHDEVDRTPGPRIDHGSTAVFLAVLGLSAAVALWAFV